MHAKLVSFVLSKSSRLHKGEMVERHGLQSAPHYFEASVPHQYIVGEEKMTVGGEEVVFLVKTYPPDILLVEAMLPVADVFSEKTFDVRKALVAACQKVAEKRGGDFNLSEEYSLVVVFDYKDGLNQLVHEHASRIAGFLKSEKLPLDETEIARTLDLQIKYGKNDLVIIGWDGAFLFDPNGDYQGTKELFQIANLQLLRYRTLDQDLSERLQKVSKLIKHPGTKHAVWSTKELARAFEEVIAVRAQSLAQFEVIDREIKLIGDWYSARLYEMLAKMVRMDEWRKSVKDKLDALEDVYAIVSQNFSMTRAQKLEYIQILLFFILQAGWFLLIFFELKYFLG